MAKKSFAEYAAKQKATWDTNDGLPDGENYVGLIEKASIKENSNGFWMMSVQIKILEGEQKGRYCFFNGNFESDKGWNPWMPKAFFSGLNLELPEFEDMEDALEALVEEETVLEFDLFTKEDSDWQNFKWGGVIEDYDFDASEDEDDDDESEGYSEDELNDMKLKELKSIAKNLEIADIPKKKDDLIEVIIEAQGEESEEEEEEEEENEYYEDLLEFAISAGVDDVDDDTEYDDLVELLSEGSFNEDELEEDEIELLKNAGLKKCIKKAKKSDKKKDAKKKSKKKK